MTRADGTSEWWVRGHQLSPAEIEDALFALGDAATEKKRGLDARQAFGEGLQKPVVARKPLIFTPRKN